MADKNLELALRIRTDLAQGKKELESFGKTIEEVGASAGKSSTGTDKLAQSAANTIKDVRAYEQTLKQTSLTTDQMAEQEQRLDRLMASGAISVQEHDDALAHLDKTEKSLNQEHAKQAASLQKVLRTADRTAAELKKLEAAEQQVTQAFKQGRIGTSEYNRAMEQLGQRRSQLEATRGAVGRLGLTSRDTRSQVITLSRSLATGNWESAGYDILRLGSSVDKTGASFLRFAVPVTAVVAVLGTFAAASFGAWKDHRELENSLILTGNAAGVTETEFDQLARSIERNSQATIGQSREIAQALVSTGRFSAQMIEKFGSNIADLQRLTGRSTDDLVKDFADMENGVAKWAAEHNRSMHFITAAEYERIRALEDAGDREAAQLAVHEAFTKAHAKQVAESLTGIESGWVKARKAASDYWEHFKNLASDVLNFSPTEGQLLKRTQFQLETRINVVQQQGGNPDEDPNVQRYRQEIADLQKKAADEQQQAKKQRDDALRQANAIAAQDRIRDLSIRADRERQMQAELDKLKKDFEAATAVNTDDADFSDKNYQRLQDEIRKRYADPAIAQQDKANEQQAKVTEQYVDGLKRQAEAIGKTAAELRLQDALTKNLTKSQREQVDQYLALIAAEEDRQQALQDSQKLEELEIELLRAQGREAEAAKRELENRFGDLRENLAKRNDPEAEQGLSLIDSLIDMEQLRLRLDEAQREIDKVLAEQQRQESSISAQREAGLITEAAARSKLVDLHKATSAELQKQIPLLQELAAQPGAVGEAGRIALEQLQSQLQQLLLTSDLLTTTIRNSLESGLTNAIEGLAKGTLSFRDAIHQLATTVTDALISMAAENIAQNIVGSFGVDTAAQQASAAAAGATMATAITTSGATAAAGMGQAIVLAGQTAAAAIAAGGVGNAAASTAGSAAGGAGGFLSSFKGLFGFAEGGLFRGKGTGTSDSNLVPISDHEFITRSSVAKQPGAVDFLRDFNDRGMAALEDWGMTYANGSLVPNLPAPEGPAPMRSTGNLPEPARSGNTEVANNFRFVNLFDIDDIARRLGASGVFEKEVLNVASNNSTAMSEVLSKK